MAQARKAANSVARSNLDLESRVLVRAKEAEKAVRKRASWIAREVSAFWNKAHRVVAYKVRTEVEAKKKEVLDRQLDVLLGQTQKYSSFLAQRLSADERAEAVVAASKAAEDHAAAVVLNKRKEKEAEVEVEATHQGRRRSVLLASAPPPPSAAVSGTAVADADDSKDYRSGEDDDADDEATLEEEELAAVAEGRDLTKDQKEEAAGLEEDADLPLEELLARYGYVGGDGGDGNDVAMKDVGQDEKSQASSPRPAVMTMEFRATVSSDDDDDNGAIDKGGIKNDSDAESERLDALFREPMVLPLPPKPSRLAAEFAELHSSDDEGGGVWMSMMDVDLDAVQLVVQVVTIQISSHSNIVGIVRKTRMSTVVGKTMMLMTKRHWKRKNWLLLRKVEI